MKNLLIRIVLIACFGKAAAQCYNANAYGSANAPAPGVTVQVTTCNYGGEYATINNAVAGQVYRSTSSIGSDYFTVRQGSPGGSVVAAGLTPLNWFASVGGSYYVHINTNSSCGTQNTCRVTSIINLCTQVLTANSSTSTSCAGYTVGLNASGMSSYTWFPGNLNGGSQTVTPQTGTTYTVVATSSVGCLFNSQLNINVIPSPTLNVLVSSLSVCAGSPVSFTASGASTYSWLPGSLTGPVQTYSPQLTTTYTLTGAGSNGCRRTGTFSIGAYPVPTVGLIVSPTVVCQGNFASFTASGAMFYTWQPGSLSGPSQSLAPGTTTTYTVTGMNSNNCTNTAVQTVSVLPLPLLTPAQTPSNGICPGFSSTISATGAFTYTWYPGILIGSTQTVTPSSTSMYTVIATAVNGCTNIQMMNLNVHPTPTISLVLSADTICKGSAASITGSGASTFTWHPSAASGNSISLTPSVSTVYSVSGASSNGCLNGKSFTIAVISPTLALSPVAPTICPGSSVALSASGAISYSWSTGGTGTSIAVSPTMPSVYNVTVNTQHNNLICKSVHSVEVQLFPLPNIQAVAVNSVMVLGGTNTIIASGGVSYLWLSNFTTGPTLTFVATSTLGNTYSVSGTDANGCKGEAAVTIIVFDFGPLGTNEYNNLSEAEVFPNPSTGHFIIRGLNEASVTVMNMLGGIVCTSHLGASDKELVVSDLADGTYLVFIEQGGERIVRKIIVAK
jgi:hypothetical protein